MDTNRQFRKEQRTEIGWSVPAGTSSSPTSKVLHRLRAPSRWWSRSTVRIVVLEVSTLSSRIRAALGAELEFREGMPLHFDIPDCMENLAEESRLQHSCIAGMERLGREAEYFGVLCQKTYFLGFREGVESLLHTADMKARRKDSVPFVAP